jgi:hypothetical protein
MGSSDSSSTMILLWLSCAAFKRDGCVGAVHAMARVEQDTGLLPAHTPVPEAFFFVRGTSGGVESGFIENWGSLRSHRRDRIKGRKTRKIFEL